MNHPIDRENLAEVLENFPNQFEEAIDLARNFKIKGSINRLIVCGMGGSALPADVVNIYLEGQVSIEVNRDYHLPAKVDKNTLVVVISYSGNTEETVSGLREAIGLGAKIAVITSGGRLKQIAEENNLPLILVPGGIQPRCATGYIFTSLVSLLENSGILKDRLKQIALLEKDLKRFKFKALAKTMAVKIKGQVPIIYASDKYEKIARICKIKFNEHAKTQSFFNCLPEMNHNEMIGYTKLIMKPYILILRNENDHERVQKRMDILKGLLQKRTVPVEEIEMKGDNLLVQCFYTLLLGDWIAYYLALEYGIDPTPVPLVEEFKDLMKK